MELDLKDVANELIILNQITIERLFEQKNLNALILYLFYYKTAKWQGVNQIKANDSYCKQCLHWGSDKLKEAKNILKQMGLIKILNKKNEKNQIDGWYIKIEYYSTTPETTIPNTPDVGKQNTNTYNNNNKYLNNNKNTIIVEKAIKYMNELAGTNFKSTSKKTQSLINARLKEGFDIEDLKDVIYCKYHEWFKNPVVFKNGVKSDTYYRPNTLFGTNFESYLEKYKKDYK